MQPTDRSVTEFLTQLDDARKRADSNALVAMMRVTGEMPRLWGRDIVGFGQVHYKYASGTEGEAPLAAFSPRKAAFSIYLWLEDSDERHNLLSRLGKHRMGKGCLYVKRLEQVDTKVLEQLVRTSAHAAKAAYDTK